MDIVERLKWRIHTSEDETALTNEAADEIERLREVLRYYACNCKYGCQDNQMNKCGYEATEALKGKE